MASRRLGAYQIVDLIGAGGMGEVYRAFRADDQYRKEGGHPELGPSWVHSMHSVLLSQKPVTSIFSNDNLRRLAFRWRLCPGGQESG